MYPVIQLWLYSTNAVQRIYMSFPHGSDTARNTPTTSPSGFSCVRRKPLRGIQKRVDSVYAVNVVIDTNMIAYCGSKNADKWSALPVPEYTCVRNTCEEYHPKQSGKLDRGEKSEGD